MRVAAPLILNQMGEAVGLAVSRHPSKPRVLALPPGPSPWVSGGYRGAPGGGSDLALHDAEILLSGPHPSWRDAPPAAPDEWPAGLRWIQSSSTGVDWAPRWMLSGTPVLTCGRGHNTVQVAEYALAALLDREKSLDRITVRSRRAWLAGAGIGVSGTLAGRTLGLAGYGSIGRAIAVRARAFGMQVRVWRRGDWATHEADEAGVLPVPDLRALVRSVDHLVLALPLTDATRRCIDVDVLAQARPGLHLVNLARGGLVDHAALQDALETGQVGFATLDVTDPEPLPEHHAFYRHDRVRLTPHLAWAGEPDRTRLVAQIHANLDAFLQGGTLRDVVDPARGY